MPPDQRANLALDRNETYYWHFLQRLILHRAQVATRLKWLGAAAAPVAFYGNLNPDDPRVPPNLVHRPGEIPFGAPLAATLIRHAVTIDVMNPGFIHGVSQKPLIAFGNGGFVLLDRKQDFVDAFGEAGEAASFRTPQDLAAKLDHFLSNPARRKEVGDTIRETIAQRYRLRDVLARVLHGAWNRVEADGGVAPVRVQEPRAIAVVDLLPGIFTKEHWTGSTVEHGDITVEVSTPPAAWAFAAAVTVPATVDDMHQPYLRISLKVRTGRIGLVAIVDSTGDLLAEQMIGPTADPVTVNLELPRFGPSTVILRNTAETASSATLLEAMLCDRIA
jgi:hypothetical protein